MSLYKTKTLGELMSSVDFRSKLRDINSICASVGHLYGVTEQDKFLIEGGLMYHHAKQYAIDDGPDPIRTTKISNFLLAAAHSKTMLEIGSNAGHSILLALSSNERLRLVSNDICHHHYTNQCLKYLKDVFGDRLEFYPGDSREIVPLLATHTGQTFDLFHVDGGHGESLCRTDIANCIRLAHPRSMLLLDDTSATHIKTVYAEFASMGYLSTENLGGVFDAGDQLLARVVPDR